MPPRRSARSMRENPESQTPDIAQLIAQQIREAVPTIVAQVTAGINASQRSEGGPSTENLVREENRNTNDRGCSYKKFMSCKPKEFHGKKGAIGLLSWIESMESVLHISKCSDDCKVEYATCQLQGRTLTWWNIQVQTRGRQAAYELSWEELKKLLIEEYCSKSEIQKLEVEFWNHTMIGMEVDKYTARFHELAKLVPHMVTPEEKRIDRYIWGLVPEIRGMVTSANPTTIQNAVVLANRLTNDAVRSGILKQDKFGGKKKLEGQSWKRANNNIGKNQKVIRNFGAQSQTREKGKETYPKCGKCNYHHSGSCIICFRCNKGDTNPARPVNQGNQGGQARGRAFAIGVEEARQDSNVVTDRSFVSLEFRPKIGLKSQKLKEDFVIEFANGQEVRTKDVITNGTLRLAEQNFIIDLIPIRLGSFDVVVGMDWLSKNQAEICCSEKTIRILKGSETLVVHGEKSQRNFKLVTCMKMRKYLKKEYVAFMAHIMDKGIKEKRIQDFPIVQDFPEVFPDELPGLPSLR
ncbi:uncharacterized protein LOC112524955 [Cynara cardunculus var. scolymus]|uniref:uncharacterized protein LOC112524955 n=1 Tax=Cynara cardunculus var. scolymus TaxID=59895 RepID=UPI000D6283D2|nr:uncharacterized protein LOC112524955 [Cynara cardunculus var. scolymus]